MCHLRRLARHLTPRRAPFGHHPNLVEEVLLFRSEGANARLDHEIDVGCFLPGEEAALAVLDDGARTAVGLELAGFLRALHALDLDGDLPVDPNGRADMGNRVRRVRQLVIQEFEFKMERPKTDSAAAPKKPPIE